jgi:aspartate/tyrosine/aromatic aminotransferase
MNRLANLNTQFESQSTASHGNQEFLSVPMAPPDAILSLSTGYKASKHPNKVNLGIGAYRSEDGKPYVFPVVRAAEN